MNLGEASRRSLQVDYAVRSFAVPRTSKQMVQEQRELQYYLSARPLFGRNAWLATTRSVKYGALCIGLQTGQTQRLDRQREREMGWSRTRGGIADETTSPSFQARVHLLSIFLGVSWPG